MEQEVRQSQSERAPPSRIATPVDQPLASHCTDSKAGMTKIHFNYLFMSKLSSPEANYKILTSKEEEQKHVRTKTCLYI